MATTRARSQVRPNDTTGRKSEDLKKQYAEEIAERQGEVAMHAEEKLRAKSDDIVDLDSNEVIKSDGSVVSMEEEDEGPVRLIGSGNTKIEEINEPLLSPTANTTDPQEKVVVRVAYDLEDVTLGYGNTYTFKEGHKYRMHRWQADHLEERGLLWSRG